MELRLQRGQCHRESRPKCGHESKAAKPASGRQEAGTEAKSQRGLPASGSRSQGGHGHKTKPQLGRREGGGKLRQHAGIAAASWKLKKNAEMRDIIGQFRRSRPSVGSGVLPRENFEIWRSLDAILG